MKAKIINLKDRVKERKGRNNGRLRINFVIKYINERLSHDFDLYKYDININICFI